MRTISASDAQTQFGQSLELSLVEPVGITESGRIVSILLSASEYDRLAKADEQSLLDRASASEQAGFLTQEETADFLNSLIHDGDSESS